MDTSLYAKAKPAWIAVLLFGTALSVLADSPEQYTRKRCDQIEEKIENIESRMRAGYTAAQGNRLQEQLRKLKTERFRHCRRPRD